MRAVPKRHSQEQRRHNSVPRCLKKSNLARAGRRGEAMYRPKRHPTCSQGTCWKLLEFFKALLQNLHLLLNHFDGGLQCIHVACVGLPRLNYIQNLKLGIQMSSQELLPTSDKVPAASGLRSIFGAHSLSDKRSPVQKIILHAQKSAYIRIR